MGESKPFLSVIIPTRNRPDLLRYAMLSLIHQTFNDFEAIVCDNHTGESAMDVFDEISDQRFKYVTPASDLSMPDNWEYASSLARGDYVTVLIDKTCLRPSALQIVHDALEMHPAEIVSWRSDSYVPLNEGEGYDLGTYIPSVHKVCEPYYFDSKRELARRFSMDERRGTEGVKYFWGKICFGAYHRNLIKKIRDRIGRLFYPISPDYTSMIAALAYANDAIDLGEPLLISFMTKLSTGYGNELRIENVVNFLRTMDADLGILEDLPLKNLYGSLHNFVGFDCVEMQKRIGKPLEHISLNTRNLIIRAKEDLDKRQWQEQEAARKNEQYALWRSYLDQLPFGERLQVFSQVQKREGKELVAIFREKLRTKLKKTPRLRKALRTILRRQTDTPVKARRFGNVIDALSFADEYYGRLKDSRCKREKPAKNME